MMFIVSFLIDYVIVSFRIFFLFNAGYTSFFTNLSNVESYLKDCRMYMLTWAMDTIISIFLHFGMLFCRFIYARYATGLEAMGKKLFHGLVCLVKTTFCLQWLLFYPIKNLFLAENYPLNTVQGRICAKTNVNQFSDVDNNHHFSIKPKLIVIIFGF